MSISPGPSLGEDINDESILPWTYPPGHHTSTHSIEASIDFDPAGSCYQDVEPLYEDEEQLLPSQEPPSDDSDLVPAATVTSVNCNRQENTQPHVENPACISSPRHSSIVPANIESDTKPSGLSEIGQDERSRYLAPQPQQLTGWAAVEKTLTDYDKQEIGGYKEDIDSLLTFTGLYSAVLTAFVVVSFTQLQEDTAAESLKVLRLIANQTAGGVALSGQLVNSTTTPFQPSVTAIRVNILWFASLVISLSTASFSILVKQWLRAYMAFTSTSPQGQMQIRHFRRSGLDKWRVLGIASMLPLFIQISLALFFVGLCFFTVDIHPTIGNTTIPLVGAWAFLLITSTLSPIFSSRCPFKTPALAPITTALCTFLYVPIIMPWIHPGRLVYALCNCGFFVVKVLLVVSLYPLRKVNLVNRKAINGLWEAIHTIIHAGPHRYELQPSECKEEKDVSRDSSRDLMILTSADTIQDNPELDSTASEATLD